MLSFKAYGFKAYNLKASKRWAYKILRNLCFKTGFYSWSLDWLLCKNWPGSAKQCPAVKGWDVTGDFHKNIAQLLGGDLARWFSILKMQLNGSPGHPQAPRDQGIN